LCHWHVWTNAGHLDRKKGPPMVICTGPKARYSRRPPTPASYAQESPPGPFLRRTPPHPSERGPAQPAARSLSAAFSQPPDPLFHALELPELLASGKGVNAPNHCLLCNPPTHSALSSFINFPHRVKGQGVHSGIGDGKIWIAGIPLRGGSLFWVPKPPARSPPTCRLQRC